MVQAENVVPIPKSGVEAQLKPIDGWLKTLTFQPKGDKNRIQSMSPEIQRMMEQFEVASGKGAGETISVFENLKRFSDGSDILSESANVVANTIKYGFSLGICVMEMYEKSSGLANLRALNAKKQLLDTQHGEFQQKQLTAAAISTFVSAYYIVWTLLRYKNEEVSKRVLPKIQLPEFTIINAQQAVKFALFYFGRLITSEDLVNDDVALVKFSIEYFQTILSEIELYKSSLQYMEEFENRHYKLEGSDFSVRGFKVELGDQVTRFEFKKVKFEEIVGNRESKHASLRCIQSLLCYDAKSQRNPMLDLGGMRTITMGFGEPGTGKSLQAAATATMLDERCKDLGIPFLYWPFPPNPVSEYQGGSAERVLSWFKRLKDTSMIIYAPIDDAENNLVNRGNRSISSGAREVISVYLTETEGSGAVIRGNYAIQLLTNRPEDIDPAVLSRIQGRSVIAGAETWQDFLDQNFLWWEKYEKHQKGFVGLEPPHDYNYFENQRRLTSLNQFIGNDELVPQNELIRDIYHALMKKHNPEKEDRFIALFYEQVKKKFPFFTSRDVRNIQAAISERIMDFDFPEKWWNDNGLFFSKSYDEKRELLIGLMRENMKGLSFGKIQLFEAIKYIDVTVAIRETTFEKAVKEQLEHMKVLEEAKRRFSKKTE